MTQIETPLDRENDFSRFTVFACSGLDMVVCSLTLLPMGKPEYKGGGLSYYIEEVVYDSKPWRGNKKRKSSSVVTRLSKVRPVIQGTESHAQPMKFLILSST